MQQLISRGQQVLRARPLSTVAIPSFLVLLDFSPESYHALRYAIEVIRASGGKLSLLHIASLDDLGESANPVVIARRLTRHQVKSQRRLEGIREILEEAYSLEIECQVAIGNVRQTLLNRVSDLTPDYLVMGRSNHGSAGSLETFVCNHVRCPVLIVPHGASLACPSHAEVVAPRSTNLTLVEPLFRVLKEDGIAAMSRTPSADVGKDIDDGQSEPSTDMLCIIRKSQTWVARLFGFSKRSVVSKTLPTLILPQR